MRHLFKPAPVRICLVALGTMFAAGVRSDALVRSDHADANLALPKWEESDSNELPGGGLWPDDFNPALIIHPATVYTGGNDAAKAGDDSWLRFLPRSLLGTRKQDPDIEPVLTEISDEMIRAGENAPGDTRVIDPQGILGEAQTEDLSRFLAFHSENAVVEARFLLLDAEQQLPPGADLSRIASGEIARGTGCLVVYPLGAPRRARIFLSQNVTKIVATAYLETLAAACRRDALEATDPVEQLQRFATQLSTRLFWLEQAHPAVKPEPAAVASPALETAPLAPVLTLSEVAPPDPVPRREHFVASLLRQKWLPWIGVGLISLLMIAMILFMLIRRTRRLRRQTVWLLPDYDHRQPVRFGGPHCGACGATVKYG